MLAPICLFTYNRLYEIKQTIKALKANYLAEESELFIFSDGPKETENDRSKIRAIREFLKGLSGFRTIKIYESIENKGLASSVINGVSNILNKYETVIVLEDDLITSPNFLNFMNESLRFYKDEKIIQSINGYSFPLKIKTNDVYFQYRTGSWGWATWNDRWNTKLFEKDALREVIREQPFILNEFKKKCGADIARMLLDSINSRNDSWYVRWAFDHYRNGRFAVYPSYSFITNIGHSNEATHCKGINSFNIEPIEPNKVDFNLVTFSKTDKKTAKEFLGYFSFKHKVFIRLKLIKSCEGRAKLFYELKLKLHIVKRRISIQ